MNEAEAWVLIFLILVAGWLAGKVIDLLND